MILPLLHPWFMGARAMGYGLRKEELRAPPSFAQKVRRSVRVSGRLTVAQRFIAGEEGEVAIESVKRTTELP
jgi:hypothetical protein